MQIKLKDFFKRLNLLQRFLLASLVILVGGTIGLGEWVGKQIELGVVHRTAATTALFVDSFISPSLQELAHGDALSQEHIGTLNYLLQNTPLGQQIFAFKVWGVGGRVLFSTQPSTIGHVFPVVEGLSRAWQGEVASQISDLENEENTLERAQQSQLLEIYSPVRLGGTGQIIAVAEFYQTVDDLKQEIGAARQRSWLIVGMAMLVMYVLLGGFMRGASDTIERQQAALSRQVDQLTDLLAQNQSLHDRIRRATARFTTLNERILRRFSAELHDGPAQDLGLALLRLDHVVEHFTLSVQDGPPGEGVREDLNVIQGSLERAMAEVRALSAGLGVPQLSELTLPETLARVVQVHEQRTRTKVSSSLRGIPDKVPLPLKITIYRLVQEALNNAYRHAGGLNQAVDVGCLGDQLTVEVSDGGPGFRSEQAAGWDQHLGLVGMRERVESLGGSFRVESQPGQGTRVSASLPLQGAGEQDE
jgi:signal transduction histidine kinase